MKMTRRDLLSHALAAWPVLRLQGMGPGPASRLAAQGYIWQQQMEKRGRPLAEGVDEFFTTVRQAGFHRVELSDAYMAPALRTQVIDALASHGLSMPSIYVGGAMHEERLADETIARAVDIARACRTTGCRAIVGNPSPKPGGAEKSDEELAVQGRMLDRMGAALAADGVQYWVHNHTPEMRSEAREWWHTLRHTDARLVRICLDIDWVHQGDQDPLALLRAAGSRLGGLHLRSSVKKRWLESFGDGDVDYRPIAKELRTSGVEPLLVVELAYHPDTVVTRPLLENLRLGRRYAERVFAVSA